MGTNESSFILIVFQLFFDEYTYLYKNFIAYPATTRGVLSSNIYGTGRRNRNGSEVSSGGEIILFMISGVGIWMPTDNK